MIVALLAGASASDAAVKSQPAALDQLVRCQAITDSDARLKCYDQQVTELKTASESNKLIVMDQEDVKKARRSLFGFSMPKLPFFGDDDDDERDSVKEVTATIATASAVAGGKWAIRLDDGSEWQTVEPTEMATPKKGMSVQIRRAALGSYMGKIDGRRSVRIKRVG
ncbi:hypothetical protein [Sphingobium olei]